MHQPLVLPLPPTINHYYENGGRNGRGGKRISAKGMSFRAEAQVIAYNQGYMLELTDDLEVQIHFYLKEGDSDNRLKPLFDALNKVVWVDDKQITKHTVELHFVKSPQDFKTVLTIYKRVTDRS